MHSSVRIETPKKAQYGAKFYIEVEFEDTCLNTYEVTRYILNFQFLPPKLKAQKISREIGSVQKKNQNYNIKYTACGLSVSHRERDGIFSQKS